MFLAHADNVPDFGLGAGDVIMGASIYDPLLRNTCFIST